MQCVMRAENLVRRFREITAVDNLSFDVYAGEILGFLGPNGAGKTTTMKMLSGLEKPDSGRVWVDPSAGATPIGLCPQQIVIWDNLTCAEQLQYMGVMLGMRSGDARNKTATLLDAFGLAEKKNKRARTLSGGMQRRLNMALALIHSPKIVLLDEPQAGLDPQSRVLVRDYIRSIRETTTVILTTHDMEEAEKLSDRICIVDRGRMLVSGTIGQIKKASGNTDLVQVRITGEIGRELVPYLPKAIQESVSVSEDTLTFDAHNVNETIQAVMAVITTREIVLEDLQFRSKSLEDIFIGLTGRRLRE